MLGAGNTAYTMGDLPAAATAYQAAVQAHPDFADGWNNLAQVLLEQHQPRDALVAIRKAIALGGPRLAAYQELHQTITNTALGSELGR
jgi:cytochrome c-type biogenesis protein CcmH/NrfG